MAIARRLARTWPSCKLSEHSGGAGLTAYTAPCVQHMQQMPPAAPPQAQLLLALALVLAPAAAFPVGWGAGLWQPIAAGRAGPPSLSIVRQQQTIAPLRARAAALCLRAAQDDAVAELLGIVEPGLEGQYSPDQRRRIDQLLEALDRVCVCVCVCVSVCVSVCLFVCLSVCLSVCVSGRGSR